MAAIIRENSSVPERIPDDVSRAIVELVEKTGLLKRDLQHKGDLEKYAARIARIDQKLLSLVEALEAVDPDLAKVLRTAWSLPARSLAFRNADHQK